MAVIPDLAPIDELLREAVARLWVPGAVLYVGWGEAAVWHRAYGYRCVRPEPRPATVDTMFDLASLTKPLACAAAVMLLVDRARISVADPVAKFIPGFAAGGKGAVTVEQLLLHTGGLSAENPVDDYREGRAVALRRICESAPAYVPGSDFIYSDLGYIVLGELVATLDPRGLAGLLRDEVFAPLGMVDTGFNPALDVRWRSAFTAQRFGRWLSGEVHDPRAAALGGVAGHAGLFGTAADVATFCRMVLQGGTHGGRRVLTESAVAVMTTPRRLPGDAGLRAYGFDVATRFSTAWSSSFPPGSALGHTGFTGTMLWIHPATSSFVVLLTNAIHAPEGGGRVVDLRRHLLARVADWVRANA